MMGSLESRFSGASPDDKWLNLRLSNISETWKRIQRLFGLIYLLFLLVALTWYNINFESSQLERDIERVEKALTIERLKPWDDFLERTASCFHFYFFGFGKGGVVTQSDLKNYIGYYESENRTQGDLISLGLQKALPVDKMKDLLDSEEHWQDCTFWAQQDTLVSYLLSLDYYLTMYFIQRLQAVYQDSLEDFYAGTHSINATVNSVLCSLGARIDSLKKPFEYSVRVGWNPFVGITIATTLWGRQGSFDDYSYFDLNGLLSKLQKLNHVSRFKKEVVNHRDLLLRVQGDLDDILTRTTIRDSIRFSREETDIRFHDLSTILRSPLLTLPDLPDSIQLPRISDLTYADLAAREIGDELLKVYFPDYLQVLKDYKGDKVGAVKMWRNFLVSQRGTAKQKIQLLGAEISSISIFYFLPLICWSLYVLTVLFMYHLRTLLQPDQDQCWAKSQVTLPIEALKAPLLFTVRPNCLGLLLILLPGVGTVLILIDQMISAGGRGIVLSRYFVLALILLYLVVIVCLWRSTVLLQKIGRGTVSNTSAILEKE